MNIAILGYGARGRHYAMIAQNSGEANVVAVCDNRPERLVFAKENHSLPNEKLFANDDDFFGAGKLADLCVVSTQDAQHREHAIKALKLGYDLLLEKPIAACMEDVMEIYNTAKTENRRVYVCHVLRYAPFYTKIKELLSSGKYGDVVTMNLTENVGHWHQAHSFVRGNWGVAEKSTPMIIAKCCHDLDLICWFMDRKCEKVTSFGSLKYFKKDRAPEGHAKRCIGCPEQGKCAYDAEKIYITDRFERGLKEWPVDIVSACPTKESLLEALKTGPYGRCVFECDNTAVDHQVVNVLFEGGATAHLTMTAFSEKCERTIRIQCEKGELYGNVEKNTLVSHIFGFEHEEIDIGKYQTTSYGHGGGDFYLIKDIVDEFNGKQAKGVTSIERSIQSHVIGFAAEESRVNGGKVIDIE